MQQESDSGTRRELQDWIKRQLDDAVHELMDRGVVQSVVVEARPAWFFPHKVLIGKVRDQDRAGSFEWFIYAPNAPTEHVSSTLASTAREAARHFSLKWQLDAARMAEGGDELALFAEDLYRWVETPELWPEDDGQGPGFSGSE